MRLIRFLSNAIVFSLLAACATSPAPGPTTDLGIAWVRDSAEYQAVSLQAFRAATLALPGYLANKNWSALPEQHNAGSLPAAIILDVDETSLTNPVFQAEFKRPFSDEKLDEWSIKHEATAVPGAAEFLHLAASRRVKIFFVTNRPCTGTPESVDPCPQKKSVIDDLVEAGLPADSSNVFLAGERDNWDSEKQSRRNFIAQSHRVIMVFGDDLSDFIPCVRSTPAGHCARPATRASRQSLLQSHAAMWGAGWYVLPNPMHGSWTSAR